MEQIQYHKTLTKLVFLSMLIFVVSKTKAESLPDSVLNEYEMKILDCFSQISMSNHDTTNIAINDSLYSLIEEMILIPGSLEYQFSNLSKRISILVSDDGKFKIYNWNMPFTDGTYQYFAIMQVNSQKNKSIHTVNLHDTSSKLDSSEYLVLSHDNWYGALYYDVVTTKIKKNYYYTLLGWDGNDLFTNKKIIDVLYFENDTTPKFGAEIFSLKDNIIQSRVFFEFAERSSITLTYNKKMQMIVFDHLSPSKSLYKNHKEYYGADFSFDGLMFKNGMWTLVEDIDVRNPKLDNK